ncbi:MAG: hypothetical protein AAGJ35_11260, partial [Myxococcota bacterium]
MTNIITDLEFKCLVDDKDFKGIIITSVGKSDHVGEIEQLIETVKECVRATLHDMNFRRVPKMIIRNLVHYAIHWLKCFLRRQDSVTGIMSPAEIIEGARKPDFNDIVFEFGQRVEVYDETTNS